jgi:hypothetical protein
MRVFRTALLALAISVPAAARADAPTPFVDTRYKVGTTYTEPGSIVSLGGSKYLVIVETDTREFVILRATAKKGVVADDKLGREVKVEAKLVARKGKEKPGEENLEILSAK